MSSSKSASASESEREVRAAGRGVIYIAFAKLYFMIAGAVIEFRLPVILSTAVFGAYGVVASIISPINNVIITGTIQAVSRFSAQTPEKVRAIQASSFIVHLMVGVPVFVLFVALAPWTAALIQDPSKVAPLRVAGLIILGYSFYAVFVGVANGQKAFHKQAGLDVCFATIRAAALLGFAMAGFGVVGVVGGWAIAVGIILMIASVVIGLPRRADFGEYPYKRVLGFLVQVAAYLILMNLIMFVDQLLLKTLSTDWFAASAQTAQDGISSIAPPWVSQLFGDVNPAMAADTQVGFYRAVQNLARLSYQAIIAATFVIFPLVSRSTFAADGEATRRYITTTIRYSMILATSIAVVFAANPFTLLDIPYSAEYASTGAPALIALAFGNVAFAVFVIAGTILNGAGKTGQAIAIAFVTLVIATVANYVVIPRFPPGRDLLLACSLATGGAMFFGAFLCGVFLRKNFGAFIPALTLVRVGMAVGAAMAVGAVIPWTSALMTLAEAVVVGLTFLAALVVTREFTRAEIGGLLKVLRKESK